ncbi:hypothetical protein GQ600_16660 [Phytophthora cactorum]|nr:hypothetical protein GQ600_16660 [Phytophthora cactorum]
MLDQLKHVMSRPLTGNAPAEKNFSMSPQSKLEKADPSTAFQRSGWAFVINMVRVKIRVFTFPSDPRKQNSYIVGTIEGGLLPVVGTLNLDDKEVTTATFTQLRVRIELLQVKDVIRRSAMFQEVLALIATSPNPHNWPPNAMQTYWFGHFTDESESIPHVIAAADEDCPISQFLNMTTSKQTGDLILVPQTQLGPVCEQCCEGCALCPPIQSSNKQ